MANLIGYLTSDRSFVHRLSSAYIRARLETWGGSITVSLDKDGEAHVRIGPKGSTDTLVWKGNVNNHES